MSCGPCFGGWASILVTTFKSLSPSISDGEVLNTSNIPLVEQIASICIDGKYDSYE